MSKNYSNNNERKGKRRDKANYNLQERVYIKKKNKITQSMRITKQVYNNKNNNNFMMILIAAILMSSPCGCVKRQHGELEKTMPAKKFNPTAIPAQKNIWHLDRQPTR
jgi:hypothetical protein